MSHSKKIASIAFTGAAATAATMMGITPTLAASHFNIKNGGTRYQGAVKGKLKAGTTAVLGDTTKNTTLTCKKAVISGSMSKSSGTTPTKLGILKPSTYWSSCVGPFGLTFKFHIPDPNPPDPIPVMSKVSPAGAIGKISKISGEIIGLGLFNTCKAWVSGTSVPWRYTNASHNFDINAGHVATLHVRKMSGFCAGTINTGDKAYFTANYTVSTPANLTIS